MKLRALVRDRESIERFLRHVEQARFEHGREHAAQVRARDLRFELGPTELAVRAEDAKELKLHGPCLTAGARVVKARA
jgi:hypothetical protein